LKHGVRVGDSDAVVVLHAAGTVAGTVGGDCGDPATPVTVAAVSAETGQSSSQELPATPGSFHLNAPSGHVELMAFCRGGRGMARMTTELSPKENVTGLRLVLEAPPLAEGPRQAAPTN
jgi:proline racemase